MKKYMLFVAIPNSWDQRGFLAPDVDVGCDVDLAGVLGIDEPHHEVQPHVGVAALRRAADQHPHAMFDRGLRGLAQQIPVGQDREEIIDAILVSVRGGVVGLHQPLDAIRHQVAVSIDQTDVRGLR
ncbi:MAG: hypothetical protein ACYTFN_20275 [Planctomycetota bacterium]